MAREHVPRGEQMSGDGARLERRVRGGAIPDVGLAFTLAFAWVLARATDETTTEVRREARLAPKTIREFGLDSIHRTMAWMTATFAVFLLEVPVFLVEDIVRGPGSDLFGNWGLVPIVVCAVTAVLSSVRFAVAWYVSDERWQNAGPILRWAVTPGNRDLVIALVIVGLGAFLALAGP